MSGPEGAAKIEPAGAHVKHCSPFQQWPETLLEDSPESLKDFQLKEKLYLDAIGYLDKGKVRDLFDSISMFHRCISNFSFFFLKISCDQIITYHVLTQLRVKCCNPVQKRPYSYSRYWTGVAWTSLQWRLMRGLLASLAG